MNQKIKPFKVRPRPVIRQKIRTAHPENQNKMGETNATFIETEIGYDDIQEMERITRDMKVHEDSDNNTNK